MKPKWDAKGSNAIRKVAKSSQGNYASSQVPQKQIWTATDIALELGFYHRRYSDEFDDKKFVDSNFAITKEEHEKIIYDLKMDVVAEVNKRDDLVEEHEREIKILRGTTGEQRWNYFMNILKENEKLKEEHNAEIISIFKEIEDNLVPRADSLGDKYFLIHIEEFDKIKAKHKTFMREE